MIGSWVVARPVVVSVHVDRLATTLVPLTLLALHHTRPWERSSVPPCWPIQGGTVGWPYLHHIYTQLCPSTQQALQTTLWNMTRYNFSVFLQNKHLKDTTSVVDGGLTKNALRSAKVLWYVPWWTWLVSSMMDWSGAQQRKHLRRLLSSESGSLVVVSQTVLDPDPLLVDLTLGSWVALDQLCYATSCLTDARQQKKTAHGKASFQLDWQPAQQHHRRLLEPGLRKRSPQVNIVRIHLDLAAAVLVRQDGNVKGAASHVIDQRAQQQKSLHLGRTLSSDKNRVDLGGRWRGGRQIALLSFPLSLQPANGSTVFRPDPRLDPSTLKAIMLSSSLPSSKMRPLIVTSSLINTACAASRLLDSRATLNKTTGSKLTFQLRYSSVLMDYLSSSLKRNLLSRFLPAGNSGGTTDKKSIVKTALSDPVTSILFNVWREEHELEHGFWDRRKKRGFAPITHASSVWVSNWREEQLLEQVRLRPETQTDVKHHSGKVTTVNFSVQSRYVKNGPNQN